MRLRTFWYFLISSCSGISGTRPRLPCWAAGWLSFSSGTSYRLHVHRFTSLFDDSLCTDTMKTTKSAENVMESSTNEQRSHQSVSTQASAPVVTYSGHHQKRSLFAQNRSSSQSSIIFDRDSHFVNMNNNNDFDHSTLQKQSSSSKCSTMAKRAAFASRTSSRSSVLSSQPTLLLNDSDYLINSSRCSTPTSSLAVAESIVTIKY